jgi:hypothetical protein
MKKFSIIKVLKTLNPSEIKDFDRFVRSPYFGGSGYLLKFWQELKKYYPAFEEDKISRERIFKRLYPGKSYNDATVRKLASGLFKMCEEYISVSEIKKTKLPERYLLMFYRSKHLHNLYETKWNEVETYYKKQDEFDFLVLTERHFLQVPQIQIASDKKKNKEVFSERMKYYEYIIIYILSILMQEQTRKYVNIEVYNFEKNIAEEFFKNINLEKFLSELEKESSPFKDVIRFNYNMMKAFQQPENPQYFLEAKKLMIKKGKTASPKAFYMYSTLMINWCLRSRSRNSADTPVYNRHIADIIEFLIKINVIVEPSTNAIDPTLFSIAFQTYNDLEEFKKAEKFLNTFSKYLNERIRENTIKACEFDLAFSREEYQKALDILSQIREVDYYDRINYRQYKLIIFYELDMIQDTHYLIHSVRQFLKENDIISKELRNKLRVFVNYYAKLIDAKEKNDSRKKDDLMFELKKEKMEFPFKPWLVSKAEKL